MIVGRCSQVFEALVKAFPEVALVRITRHRREYSAQRMLKRPGKLGLGTAYNDALKVVKGSFVILMDADLSHHVRQVESSS